MKHTHVIFGVVVAVSLACVPSTSFAQQVNSFTDFELFGSGTVHGQGGWKALGVGFDQEVVVEDSGNQVWRVSNAFTSGSFGDQPFAPCPGGDNVPSLDTPVPQRQYFAGESGTGAGLSRFYAEFNFKSATGDAQSGLRITVSADNCQGARQSFIAIEDNGKGIDVVAFNVNRAGNFGGPVMLAKSLSYTDWHTFAVEIVFRDGVDNDIVRYYVNGQLAHENGSWEDYYRNWQATLHPDGVPVQTLLFRMSGTAAPAASGNGYFVDNVLTQVSYPVRPPIVQGK